MRALTMLLEHDVLGQRGRFERFAAEMLYIMAAGAHIDTNRVERFGVQLDEIYRNPFEKKEQPMTAAEIKRYIIKRLVGTDGLTESGGKDNAG